MVFFRTFFFIFLALVVLWLSGYAVFVLAVLSQKPADTVQPSEAIVVLTGGSHRVNTGLDLFASRLSPRLFISGVHNDVDLDSVVAEWPGLPPEGKRNLPACCMEIGHHARTTAENAQEVSDWIEANDVHSIRLVTSPYHMPRALLEFQSLMPDLHILPHPVMRDALSPRDAFFWRITFVEYHKLLYRSVSVQAGRFA